jgi:hypothetical protein
MPPPEVYSIELIDGVKESRRRRVVLLASSSNKTVNAVDAIESLRSKHPKSLRELMTRFDYWIDGNPDRPKWCHGWNDKEFEYCYVFKWRIRGNGNRIYGFRYHPQPLSNSRLEICVLAHHATKKEHNTDQVILGRTMALHGNTVVRKAIADIFPDR